MVLGTGLDAFANTGAPQAAGLVQFLRLDEPTLARAEGGQTAQQLLFGLLNDGTHLGLDVLRVCHVQGVDRVEQLTAETLGVCNGAHQNNGGASGALLACVAECRVDDVLDGQVDVSVRGNDNRVLTRGLTEQRQVITPGAEELSGLVTTGQDQAVHLGVRDEDLTGLAVDNLDQLQNFLGDACIPHDLCDQGTGASGDGCGLENHCGAGCQTCQNTTGGNSGREVPRGNNQGQVHRLGLCAINLLEVLGQHCVVVCEVDCLGDLGVALLQGLASLGCHDLQQIATTQGDSLTDLTQNLCALVAGELAPSLACFLGFLDQLLGLSNAGQLVSLQGVDAQLGGLGALEDCAAPLAVTGQCGVGVGGVLEAASRHEDVALVLGQTVLGALGCGNLVGDGVQCTHEAVLFALEDGLVGCQVEDTGHEVLGGGVLLETTDQVCDSNVEFLGVHDGHVQQQVTHAAADNLCLLLGHTNQHLELDAILHAAVLGEQQCESNVEEVVACNTEADVLHVLGAQCVVQNALVVGVSSLLGVPGGQRPAVHDGFHDLHGEVCTLHQADLDAGAASLNTLGSPCLQTLHSAQGVGQVCLEHDTGFQVLQVRLVQNLGEHLDGQVEVLVLLHVQVDELLGGGRSSQLVQRGQAANSGLNDLVECPVLVGAGDCGHLDGDVVDVVASQQTLGLGQAVLSFLVTQHGLAEQVDVQAVTALGQLCDSVAQLLLGSVDNQVANHLTQNAACDGNGGPGNLAGQLAAEANGGLHVPGKEGRCQASDAGQVTTGDVVILGANHAIDEADGEGKTVRVLQNACQLLSRKGGLNRLGLVHPLTNELTSFLSHLLVVLRCERMGHP